MNTQPDWGNYETFTSLKAVLKWEIHHLLHRLAEVGEEGFVFTLSLNDGDTTELGSPRGEGFLSMSDLQNVKSQFQSYCQVPPERREQEVYRDLSTGRLSLGPKSTLDSGQKSTLDSGQKSPLDSGQKSPLDSGQKSTNDFIQHSSINLEHRRKRRRKSCLQQLKWPRVDNECQASIMAYLQQQKRPGADCDGQASIRANLQLTKEAHVDCKQHTSIKQELLSTSDENSGNSVNQDDKVEWRDCAMEAAMDKSDHAVLSMRSRRKRMPKKIVTSYDSDENPDVSFANNGYQSNDEIFDTQSENLETTVSMSGNFCVKKSQSMDQISVNKSEPQEFLSGVNTYNRSISNKGMESNILNQSTSLLSSNDDNEFRKTKDPLPCKVKNYRKSIKSNPTTGFEPETGFETESVASFQTDQSMPVFPNLDNLRKSSIYANNVVGADIGGSDVGGADDASLPRILFDEDGNMRMVPGEIGVNSSPLENSRLLGQQSVENSPKLDMQVFDSSPLNATPSRKKGFKPVPHDENSAETALLDASKLGVGRYKCPMCGQTTRDRHDLKRHLRTHTKEKPYQCSLCEKKFTRKWDLENHYTRHNKSEQDEMYAKIPKQLNKHDKTAEASYSEILTYDKLVSKLLKEKNILQDEIEDPLSAEGEDGVMAANEGNSKNLFDNLNKLNFDHSQTHASSEELMSKDVVIKTETDFSDDEARANVINQTPTDDDEVNFGGKHANVEKVRGKRVGVNNFGEKHSEVVQNEEPPMCENVDGMVDKFLNDRANDCDLPSVLINSERLPKLEMEDLS